MRKQVLFLPVLVLGVLLTQPFFVLAQTGSQSVNVNSLIQKSSISFSPRTGSFLEGSTFEVLVTLNTYEKSVNAVELRLNFDPRRLAVVSPSGGKSIVGLWVEPPSYSNVDGVITLAGVIPGGINTESGLVTTVTFKGIASGDARITLSSGSRVLANDGLGTETNVSSDTGSFSILPRAPLGPRVFSETHPLQDNWYNNKNIAISWEKDPGITHFSYEVDTKPFTIPDNKPETTETATTFAVEKDGLTYFHVKGEKQGVWGGTSHFLTRVDSIPPAEFKPSYDVLAAALIYSRAVVSFFTTDSLSGMDHYEVGIINKNEPASVSPIFVETESPYQLPLNLGDDARVIVRAFDRAGNVREGIIDLDAASFLNFLENNLWSLFLTLLLLGVATLLVMHYVFGHHLLSTILKRTLTFVRKEEKKHDYHEDE